jgi:hypothetical protein
MRADGYVVVGFDWSRGNHPIGGSAVIYACFYDPGSGSLIVTSDGAGVVVTPLRVSFPAHSNGIVPLHVTAVGAPATASLAVTVRIPANVATKDSLAG